MYPSLRIWLAVIVMDFVFTVINPNRKVKKGEENNLFEHLNNAQSAAQEIFLIVEYFSQKMKPRNLSFFSE